MLRGMVLRPFVVIVCCAAATVAQENPLNYAKIAIAECGKLGQLLHEGTGTGQKGSRTTNYRSAGFEITCDSGHLGQVDIQTADHEPPVVSYRHTKGEPDSQPLFGPEVEPLVRQSIGTVCSCSAN